MSSTNLKQELTEYLLYCVKNDDTLVVEEVLPMTLVWTALRQETNTPSTYVPNFANIFEALANVHVTQELYDMVMQILRRFDMIPPPLSVSSCEEEETRVSYALKLMGNTNFYCAPQKLAIIAGLLQVEMRGGSFEDTALMNTLAKVSTVLYEKQEDTKLVELVIQVLKE